MKTFEEKWTAWLDDQLSGRELSEFEASLPDKAAAQAEKAEAKKLGELLKRELSAHPLKNEEFFSHQLRERIVQESGEQPSGARSPKSNLQLVDDSAPAVGGHGFARCVFNLHRPGHASGKTGRGIAISDTDSQCPGRSCR